jgi:hypothetical protein
MGSYEIVPVHSAPFRTRAQIDVFCQLYRCQLALEEGVDLKEVVASIAPPTGDSDWLEEHRQRLIMRCGVCLSGEVGRGRDTGERRGARKMTRMRSPVGVPR